MSERITIGQYLTGDSFLHRLDPRVKIFLTIVFMVCIFLVSSYWGYAVFLGFVLLCMIMGEVPPKQLFKGLRPIFLILLFTFAINLLTTPGELLFEVWVLRVTQEGLHKAVFIAIRIVLLVLGTSLLTLTTSPLSLTDGMEALMKPLTLVRFPAHELAMMISIALRFIPTLFDESDKIMRAQKARGADFESGNLFQRARAMIPLMVPLFLNAFRRAEELGTAMEARCYRGGAGRTRLNPLRMARADWMTFGLTSAALLATAWIF